MSESVSFKVVVIWIIFICTFACLGVFGFLNQDLLKDKTNEEIYVPQVNSENSITCSASLERGNLKYDFILNTDGTIKTLRIAYNSSNSSEDDYITANQIKELNVLGVEATLQGSQSEFMLIIYINTNNTDINSLLNYSELFNKLGVSIFNEKVYTEYNNKLHNVIPSIKCEANK